MIYLSKQQASQKYIYKIHSTRLRKANWKLTLPLSEARKNEEVIALADSQILRWIDELNAVIGFEETAKEIKKEIKRIKREPSTRENKIKIRQLYNELDCLQFKPDYMCLIIDKEKDYRRACNGFSINGISYKRLLGTVNGIKNSTIVFVSERLHEQLALRIENGRNKDIPVVPAKLEAYKSLTCSASVPVSLPKGILVVKDVETKFVDNTIYLNDECDGEPEIKDIPNTDITMDCTDGFGLMLPSLAKRWSEELKLDYVVSGLNTRFSWEKGMVFTFDFLDFAENVAHNYIVKDVWGNDIDIRNVELIFTESMLKLWDAYDSIDDYLEKCAENKYTIGVTKTCPEYLERERNLNYQFIQSYKLSNEQIDELINPTISEMEEIISGDWRKSILFLCGKDLDENNIMGVENNIAKAIMICPELLNDAHVQKHIQGLIKKRIDEAKTGVIKIHGNFSIVSGDPYILCQGVFGMEPTGLLKAGEIYNKYWIDYGAEELACFRAPMSCHNNIRLVRPVRNENIDRWYKYMTTCTVFNAWDTATAALNGCDYDGDLVMLTDNKVLVDNLEVLPAITCVQRRATKIVPSETDLIQSNIDSFGNSIGKITNRVTSMFEIQARYDPDSEEYKTLDYRIKCGQLLQQNAIDAAKGIVAKPMPRTWYDRHSISQIEDDAQRSFYRSIVADKKPYFMRYIYPDLSKQYSAYIKNTNKCCLREFGITIDELINKPYDALSHDQREFIRYFNMGMPVGVGECVMNIICKKIESKFSGYVSKHADKNFDYTIMKCGEDYTPSQYAEVRKLYEDYNKRIKNYAVFSRYERVDADEVRTMLDSMKYEFVKSCYSACSNKYALCDMLLDLCYKKSFTKRFAWDIVGDVIVENLLTKNGMHISFPSRDENGDIMFNGEKFSIITKEIEVFG